MQKSPEPLQKHPINLFKGDYDRLRDIFRQDPSLVIRMAVRRLIEANEAAPGKLPKTEVQL